MTNKQFDVSPFCPGVRDEYSAEDSSFGFYNTTSVEHTCQVSSRVALMYVCSNSDSRANIIRAWCLDVYHCESLSAQQSFWMSDLGLCTLSEWCYCAYSWKGIIEPYLPCTKNTYCMDLASFTASFEFRTTWGSDQLHTIGDARLSKLGVNQLRSCMRCKSRSNRTHWEQEHILSTDVSRDNRIFIQPWVFSKIITTVYNFLARVRGSWEIPDCRASKENGGRPSEQQHLTGHLLLFSYLTAHLVIWLDSSAEPLATVS